MRAISCSVIIGFCLLFCILPLSAQEEPTETEKISLFNLPDELIAKGIKQYPGSVHRSSFVDPKDGGIKVTFTTTDPASDVLAFYRENFKNLVSHGYQKVEKGNQLLRGKGLDPVVKNTLIYQKDSTAVQVKVKQHKNLKDLNKILIYLYRTL